MFRFLWLLLCLHLVTGQSCVGRCFDSADSAYTCQCNSLCDTYGDCCADFIPTCVPDGTCSGRCYESFNPNNDCHCTPECGQYNNCCLDYDDVCSGTGGSGGSCVGRCDSPLDTSQPCQCNSACSNYGDCCSDYQAVCNNPGPTDQPPPSQCAYNKMNKVSNSDLLQVSLELFDLDINRASPDDIVFNKQSSTSTSSTQDNSPDPLFTYVNNELFSLPSYAIFIDLLDNYEKTQGINENVEDVEEVEQDAFLDAFMDTPVGIRLYDFFFTNGLLNCPDESTFKYYMKEMWFGFYSRQNGAQDTSGFEHAFVGEIKSGSVSGFHSWVQFYLEEQNGKMEYFGYTSYQEPGMLGVHFTWHDYMKPLSGAVIGVSPEYELALYTLCHVVKPDSVALESLQWFCIRPNAIVRLYKSPGCNILMRDESGAQLSRSIQTWAWSKTSPGYGLKYVASSYFLV